MKRTPLKRKSPLKRGGPLKKASKRYGKELRAYSVKRKAFLGLHLRCQRCYTGWSSDVHHKAGRGKHLNDESTWMAVCRSCHDWIHAHPKESRQLGYLL